MMLFFFLQKVSFGYDGIEMSEIHTKMTLLVLLLDQQSSRREGTGT
jgi:hypothetical protein